MPACRPSRPPVRGWPPRARRFASRPCAGRWTRPCSAPPSFTSTYGAAQHKYLPAHAFDESAERLAERWTSEWRDGIEGTGIRPGFLKTGVDAGPLSPVDRKLITAAAVCHRRTGLRIHCHTGDGPAAMDILTVLDEQGVSPATFVWVHAQNEKGSDAARARRPRGRLNRAGRRLRRVA